MKPRFTAQLKNIMVMSRVSWYWTKVGGAPIIVLLVAKRGTQDSLATQ